MSATHIEQRLWIHWVSSSVSCRIRWILCIFYPKSQLCIRPNWMCWPNIVQTQSIWTLSIWHNVCSERLHHQIPPTSIHPFLAQRIYSKELFTLLSTLCSIKGKVANNGAECYKSQVAPPQHEIATVEVWWHGNGGLGAWAQYIYSLEPVKLSQGSPTANPSSPGAPSPPWGMGIYICCTQIYMYRYEKEKKCNSPNDEVVFESPVRSGLLPSRALDHNRNWSS